MDPQQARASLDEVRHRERQVEEAAVRDGSPWWYVGGIAAAFLAIAVASDLDEIVPTGRLGFVLDYGVPVAGIAVIIGLAIALHRSMGMRPRRWPRRAGIGIAVWGAAFLVVFIGVGTALRAADVAWSSTIGGVVATLVFLGGNVVLRRSLDGR